MSFVHEIPPVCDETSRILVLGSFPSVKSREAGFFYHHPQNRFWKVLAGCFEAPVPQSIDEKKTFLLKHHVAVWDVIASCSIDGSSDASIRDVVPADLMQILSRAPIEKILCNGKTAARLYHTWQEERTGLAASCLPSTSPANAAWSVTRLIEAWKAQICPQE